MEEKRQRNLKIVEERKNKYLLTDISQRHNISIPRVFAILRNTKKKLRTEKQFKNQNGA